MRHNDESFDLDQLLHPAQAFGHPSEVVHDADLTLNEKRAILASWASDACAVSPDLRATPSGTVPFDDVMDALRELDKEQSKVSAKYRRMVRRQLIFGRGGDDGRGRPHQ